jgi:hypothetical protein
MLNQQNNRTFQFSTTNILEAILRLFPSQWTINDEGSSFFRTVYTSVSFSARLDVQFHAVATFFLWNENKNRLLLPRLQKTSKAEENDSSKKLLWVRLSTCCPTMHSDSIKSSHFCISPGLVR